MAGILLHFSIAAYHVRSDLPMVTALHVSQGALPREFADGQPWRTPGLFLPEFRNRFYHCQLSSPAINASISAMSLSLITDLSCV